MSDRNDRQFDRLLANITPGNIYFVTGKNGSGKSRLLGYATNRWRWSQVKFDRSYRKRLLCMSGTMHDRYPSNIYKATSTDGDTVYLGSKVNNNMVSELAPFRTMCYYMLHRISLGWSIHGAKLAFQRLDFDSRIRLRFRLKRKVMEADNLDATPKQLNLLLDGSVTDTNDAENYLHQLRLENIVLANIEFFRHGKVLRLGELSSGEKQYVLALFGFVFCGDRHCTLLYDEPENSLHPAWQLSIVRDLADIAENMHTGSTLIIATHSPLIASSVHNDHAYVCDLPEGQAWHHSDLYGRASDTVLREQFHLYSARSPEVSAIIDRCLGLIARNETDHEKFQIARDELKAKDLKLLEDDPLYSVVATILDF